MPKVLLDVEPLRVYPEFRRLWIGFAASSVGTQMSVVAIALEVYRITGSNLDVGLISLIQLFPAIIGSLLGGSIADAMDRRKLLVITGGSMAVLSTALAIWAESWRSALAFTIMSRFTIDNSTAVSAGPLMPWNAAFVAAST